MSSLEDTIEMNEDDSVPLIGACLEEAAEVKIHRNIVLMISIKPEYMRVCVKTSKYIALVLDLHKRRIRDI